MKKFLFVLTVAALFLVRCCYAEDTPICPGCSNEAADSYCSECGHVCGASLPELEEDDAYLSMKLVYEKNIVFAKFDVDVRVDDQFIGTVRQGETLEKTIVVKQGVHEITLQSNESIKTGILIDVVEEGAVFSCTIKAHTTSLELMDVTNSSPVSSKSARDFHINRKYGSCSGVDYERICRYPEKYKDEAVHINGVVVAAAEGFLNTMMVVIQDQQNHLWLTQYNRQDNEPRLLLNDSVDLYGFYAGIGKYQDATGTVVDLPKVKLEYLLIN